MVVVEGRKCVGPEYTAPYIDRRRIEGREMDSLVGEMEHL